MKKNVFLICILLLTTSVVFGQGFTFKVLANKGQNKVKKESGELVTLKDRSPSFRYGSYRIFR